MKKTDLVEFAKALTALASVHGEEVTRERIDVYFDLLKEHSIEQVKAAAFRLGKTLRFFPKPADFIDAIDGSIEERASVAWYKYLEALSRPGPYKTLNIGDPYAHAAISDMDLWGQGIERNGYPDNRSDCDFIRQEFIRRYKVHAKHSNLAQLPQSLPGIFEIENAKKIAAGEHRNWTAGQLAFVQKNQPQLAPALKKELPEPEKK